MKPEFLVVAAIVSTVHLLPAAAQEPPSPMAAIPAPAQQQLEQMSRQGGPLQGASGRINRMTDPNAGKRPGDEKLSCEQIKAEFDDTKKKYLAQQARRDAAKNAAEANAREAQADSSGPAAVAKGFVGGLGAVAARATGTGDAYNEKLKAEAIATQSRKEEVQMQFAQEAEASKAISDRGRALMSLGNTKSCQGLSYSP